MVRSSCKVRRELEKPHPPLRNSRARPVLTLPISSAVGNASPAQGPGCAVRIVPCEVLLDVNRVKAACLFPSASCSLRLGERQGMPLSFPGSGAHVLSPLPFLAASGRPCFPGPGLVLALWGSGRSQSRRGGSLVLPVVVPVCVVLPALPHSHPLVPHLYPTQRLHSLGA